VAGISGKSHRLKWKRLFKSEFQIQIAQFASFVEASEQTIALLEEPVKSGKTPWTVNN